MSATTVKAAAAASVQATIQADTGAIAIPSMDSVEAIRMSVADETVSHRLGREHHTCRR